MDALGAAAAAVERMDADYEPPVDPDDMEEERGRLVSDDEEGPPMVDDDTDALPPGTVIQDDGDGVEATNVAAEEAGVPAEVPVAAPPPLPVDVKLLKADELREHLAWRGLSKSGNKPELQARLQRAIADKAELLSLDAFRARYGAGAAQAQVATAAAQWEPVDPSKISRPEYTGPEKFLPNPALGFTPSTHPFTYMNAFYPKRVRDTEVENSKRYRGWIKAMYKEIYASADDPTTHSNSLAHATLLLQGLNPVPDQRKMWSNSFAYKSHRGADLLTRNEWKAWKAFFHISHPGQAPAYGTKYWDELHKVRPMLDAYLEACINNVTAGRKFSIDEITIGFQGHHARLKLRCGKFKRAGDGFQADAIVLQVSYT